MRPTYCAPGTKPLTRQNPKMGPVGTWSGKRDSNSRPQPWQGCALPTELFPRKPTWYRKSGTHTSDFTFLTARKALWPNVPRLAVAGEKQGPYRGPVESGAGKETCTRTLSRCFPNTFFAEVASEDLNCSLVFRPRQQVRPKKSNDVQRRALRTGAAFGNIAIRTASNSPHQFSASTSNAMPTS